MNNFFIIILLATTIVAQPENPYILVIGTAQDAGYPQANCDKDLCRRTHQNPEFKRFVSSLALVDPVSNQYWLFDATPDVTEQLKLVHDKSQINTIPTGIFLTHAHIGHYTGLMYFGREVIGAKELPVYTMPRMKTFIETNGPWSQLVKLKNIQLRRMANKNMIKLNERLSVEAFLVPHRDEFSETVGYRIIGPQKTAIFIPDINKWSIWEESIVDYVKNSDMAFLDGSFYDQQELPGRDMSEIPHPFIIESMQTFKDLAKSDRSKIQFIHFNHSNYLLDPSSEQYKVVIKAGFKISEQGTKISL